MLVPNPFTSGGAKWDIMAAYGAQLEQGKSRRAGPGLPQEAVRQRAGARQERARVAPDVHRAARATSCSRYENEAILAQQQGEEIDYVVPDQTILIENPVAVDQRDARARTRRRRSWTSSTRPRPRRSSRARATARSWRAPRRISDFPTPPGLFEIDEVRRLGRRERQVLRPGQGRDRRDIQVPGEEHCLRLARRPAPPPRRRRRVPRASHVGGVLGRGVAMTYLSIVALIPLAAVVAKSLDNGVGAFWDAMTTDQAVAALKLTLIASVIVVVVNAVFGTLIAWVLVRDEFPGKGIVNSLIDLPFALPTIVAGLTLLVLYGPGQPGRHQPRLHPRRGGAGAAVRDAAVRRARGAARPARARHRDGAGRRVAGSEQGDRLPPHHPAQPDARRSSPAPAWRSPAPSASSARSS